MAEEDPQIFVEPETNFPIRFFLHENLTSGQKEALEKRIQSNGGLVISDSDTTFECIIVKEEDVGIVSEKYRNSRTIYVEPISFIKRCIGKGKYFHDTLITKNPGGAPVGGMRQEYTQEDDAELVRFLAIKLPYIESGGRSGNEVYKMFVTSSDDFPQASRHPWQSWRNRYKHNKKYMDDKIREYNEQHPPNPHRRGEYLIDTRASRNNKRGVYVTNEEEEEEEEQEDENNRVQSRSISPIEIDRRNSQPPQRKRQIVDDENESLERSRRRRKSSNLQVPREHGSTNGTGEHDDFYNDNDYPWDQQFTPDIDLHDELHHEEDSGPSNTQATLVADAIRMKNDNVAADQNPPTPSRAARNRERAVMERRAKAKTQQTSTAPPDTQATVVGHLTQAGLPSSQVQTSKIRVTGQRNAARKTVAGPKLPAAKLASELNVGRSSRKQTGPSKKGPSIEEMQNVFYEGQSEPPATKQDAPYRNTRARSRSVSVEPQTRLPPPKRTTKKFAMEPIRETRREDEELPSEEENSFDAVESVLELVEDESQQVSASRAQRNTQIPDSDEEEEAGPDSGSDDDDDELQAHAKRLFNKEGPTVPKPPSTDNFSVPPRVPLSASNGFAASLAKAGKAKSLSSESDFPASGTQARREKDRRVDHSKKSPYHPPPMTRAAEVINSTVKRLARPDAKSMLRK